MRNLIVSYELGIGYLQYFYVFAGRRFYYEIANFFYRSPLFADYVRFERKIALIRANRKNSRAACNRLKVIRSEFNRLVAGF